MEVVVLWFLCGVTCAVIANSKGRSGAGWFMLGCLLSVFAVIMIACMPRLASEQTEGV